jgi:membrane-bound serine protease (ClpP class)
MRAKFIIIAGVFLMMVFPLPAENVVHVITIDGVINPASSEFVSRAIRQAQEEDVHCLVILLDTPGGLVTSMRDMTKDMLGSKIPVVVYVAPSGARAGSAGVFVTLAANVAAMAPGTNIGAASVVTMTMGADSASATMLKKATNDAVAYIRSIAEERGRNEEWAEKAVTDAVSVTATEALELNVIDFISPHLDSLLILMDGMVVKAAGDTVRLATRTAIQEIIDMPLRFKILDVISDPTIAYILFIIGLYGLFFELYNPGAIFPGVVGAISMILAFYAMNTLPVNYAGILLILLAIILFLLEIKIPSYGILTIGGVISFLVGSIMLYDPRTPFVKVSWEVIIAVTVTTALFFIFAVGMGLRAQFKKPVSGREEILDTTAEALEDFQDGEGQVLYEGEIWHATSVDPVKKNDIVKVVQLQGLRMTVKKMT